MQNCLVDYVDSKSQTESFEDLQQCSEMSPFFYPYQTLLMIYFISLLNIFHWRQYDLGGSSRLMVMVWENVWIVHTPYPPKDSLAGSHACPRAPDVQMKKEVWYLAIWRLQSLFQKLCHVTYCHSQPKRAFPKLASTRSRQNSEKSLWVPLGPRKIVFITTYIECKRLNSPPS